MTDKHATHTGEASISGAPGCDGQAHLLRHTRATAGIQAIGAPTANQTRSSRATPKLHHAIATAAAAATRLQANPVDLGWAGGFFDADGHIGTPTQKHQPRPNGNPRKSSFRLIAVVSQNNLEVLEYFQGVVGAHGNIQRQVRNIGQNRQCYSLVYSGRHALEVIYLLRPHLHRKHYEADVAKELAIQGKLGMHPGPNGFSPDVQRARNALRKKLRRLK